MPISEQVKRNAKRLALKALVNAMSDEEIKAGFLEATIFMARSDLTKDMAAFGSSTLALFADELTKRKVSRVCGYPNLNTISKLH